MVPIPFSLKKTSVSLHQSIHSHGRFPPLLNLQLKRFHFDLEKMDMARNRNLRKIMV
jgi:hypothetical protein